MKPISFFLFISLILLTGVSSCKKDIETAPDMGYNYFPVEVGKFVVYTVDSFYYNDFTSAIDTFKFQLKEKIQSTYLDNQNRTTLRLERYIRNYDPLVPYTSLPWILRDVWAANRTATTAEKVEENVRYVKLAFAVKEDQRWNGNAQNINSALNYSYGFFNQPRTVSGVSFDSVLQVNQLIDEDLISKKYYVERYAKGYGLIAKNVIDIESQPNTDWSNAILFPFGNDSLLFFYATPIMQRVTSGFQYTYIYNSSGIE